jgi:hypothetical protein
MIANTNRECVMVDLLISKQVLMEIKCVKDAKVNHCGNGLRATRSVFLKQGVATHLCVARFL